MWTSAAVRWRRLAKPNKHLPIAAAAADTHAQFTPPDLTQENCFVASRRAETPSRFACALIMIRPWHQKIAKVYCDRLILAHSSDFDIGQYSLLYWFVIKYFGEAVLRLLRPRQLHRFVPRHCPPSVA